MPIYSVTELERPHREAQEPGRNPGVAPFLVRAFPEVEAAKAAAAIKKPKPVPVALDELEEQPAPVPVKKKKVIITDMNTGIRKVEYR